MSEEQEPYSFPLCTRCGAAPPAPGQPWCWRCRPQAVRVIPALTLDGRPFRLTPGVLRRAVRRYHKFTAARTTHGLPLLVTPNELRRGLAAEAALRERP